MDEATTARAKAAGLDIALRDFPDDLAEAARVGAMHAGAIKFPADPAAEPWPAMDVSVGRAGVSP